MTDTTSGPEGSQTKNPKSAKKRTRGMEGIESVERSGQLRYRGTAWDKHANGGKGKKMRGPWVAAPADAKAWRTRTLTQLADGTITGTDGVLFADAVERFVDGITDGTITNRSGDRFKPSTSRNYRRDLKRVSEEIGSARLDRLTIVDLQRVADGLIVDGLSPSSVRGAIMAVRALYGWARPRGLATANPCEGVRLPAARGKRDRIATPQEAAKLVAALEVEERAAFGLAVYGGLRAGELLALDWSSVDLGRGVVRVTRGWDHGSGRFIAPKSKAARREVPIVERLSVLLTAHRANGGTGLVFPAQGKPDRPRSYSGLVKKLSTTWIDAELNPLGLHEARHTFASVLIAAGCNAKAISTYLGHGSIAITFDRYGHLMPGHEEEVRGLVDDYLAVAA